MDNKTDWQISKSSLTERFTELFRLNEWTDCAFSVGNDNVEVIKCHKLVLVASSPVFEALFYGPLANYDKVIHVPDLEPKTFKLLLRYMYCDKVEFSSIIDAGMLLYASKKYLLFHLSRKCLDYIIQHMQITNLWEVLDVAESLNEEELLETCLKVMRQYSVDMWSSSSEHLSKTVLCRLLDQDPSNISETELWTFIISWAEMECRLKNIKQTPENIRSIIDDGGLLKKIRFLTFTKKDMYELVEPSGIISRNELAALNKCIESIDDKCCDEGCDKCVGNDNTNNDTTKTNNNNNNNLKNNDIDNLIVPDGFNSNRNKRMRVMAYINHCPRTILTKLKTWIYGGKVCTKVSSFTRALVIGFEVFTRIPSAADFCLYSGNLGHYNERLMVKICDSEGAELSKTFCTQVAEFNTSQNIKLNQPVWFYPHRTYTVTFELSGGQYPLCQLSGCAVSKTTQFCFEEPSTYSNDCNGFGFSFITAVMFSL